MKKLTTILLLICSLTYGQSPAGLWASGYFGSGIDTSGIIVADWYVSPNGDNTNGLTPSTAYNSFLDLATNETIVAGDTIAFERGETFSETIHLDATGTSGNPIVLTAYGSGEKPNISGFEVITTGWTNEGGGIYSKVISAESQTKMVLLDGVEAQEGRYPNLGSYLFKESESGTNTIIDNDLTGTPNYNGMTLVLRRDQWTWGVYPITSHSTNTITFSGNSSSISSGTDGYFIQGDLSLVDQYGEWYHDYSGTGKLYVYFGATDPTTVAVKVAVRDDCLYMDGTPWKYYINIDNLAFEGAINYGNEIYGYKSEYFNITNCDYRFIGETAIKTDGCIHYVVENCDFQNSTRGIYAESCADWTVQNNNFNRIGLVRGANKIITNGMNNTPINLRLGPAGQWYEPQSILVQNNRIDSCGYNGIHFKSRNADILDNYITYYCLTQSDGGGIYTAGAGNTDVLIDGNICLYGSDASAEGTGGTSTSSEGIYLDENADSVTISNNLCAFNSARGIKLHKASDVTVQYNTCYANREAFGMENYEVVSTNLANLNVQYNKFIMKTSTDLGIFLWSEYSSEFTVMGTLDNNTYAKPVYSGDDFQKYKSSTFYTLAGWKTFSGKETNSTEISETASTENDIIFEFNPPSATSAISVPMAVPMYDIVYDANYPAGSLLLQPGEWTVLIPQ